MNSVIPLHREGKNSVLEWECSFHFIDLYTLYSFKSYSLAQRIVAWPLRWTLRSWGVSPDCLLKSLFCLHFAQVPFICVVVWALHVLLLPKAFEARMWEECSGTCSVASGICSLGVLPCLTWMKTHFPKCGAKGYSQCKVTLKPFNTLGWAQCQLLWGESWR